MHAGGYAGEGESAGDVSARVLQLFKRLEEKHEGQTILLVSHGDVLSILWATMHGLPLQEHRNYALQTGELRALQGSA